jgi:transposase InsO family protein
VIVATYYFTKWTDAIPLKNMTHREVIEFIIGHIIHRFGIPQTLTMDQGTSFISKEVREFVDSYGIKLLNLSPYYAQANGQAESSNKTLVKLIKKKIEDDPRRWLTSARIRAPFDGKIISLNDSKTITLEVETTIRWRAA